MRRVFVLTLLLACFVALAGNVWAAGGTCTQDKTQDQIQTPLQTQDNLQTRDQLQDQSCTDPSGANCQDKDYYWLFKWLFGM